LATGGDRNSARATRFSSTAIVDGNGSSAQVFVGDYNTAIATGDFIGAVGQGGGDSDIQPRP
jgi:hypothetical protein